MATSQTRFRRKDYLELPEGFPAELVRGMLVKTPTPPWGHQMIVVALLLQLSTITGKGRILPSVDVAIDDENIFRADLVVLAPEDRVTFETTDVAVPILVVEVLSPSTRRRDLAAKAPRYLARGVEEVWLVDPAAGGIEVRERSGVVRCAVGAERIESRVVPGFAVSWAELAGPGEGTRP